MYGHWCCLSIVVSFACVDPVLYMNVLEGFWQNRMLPGNSITNWSCMIIWCLGSSLWVNLLNCTPTLFRIYAFSIQGLVARMVTWFLQDGWLNLSRLTQQCHHLTGVTNHMRHGAKALLVLMQLIAIETYTPDASTREEGSDRHTSTLDTSRPRLQAPILPRA